MAVTAHISSVQGPGSSWGQLDSRQGESRLLSEVRSQVSGRTSLLKQCRHDNMGTRPLGHWVNANLHPILVAGYNQIKLIGYIALSFSTMQIA